MGLTHEGVGSRWRGRGNKRLNKRQYIDMEAFSIDPGFATLTRTLRTSAKKLLGSYKLRESDVLHLVK